MKKSIYKWIMLCINFIIEFLPLITLITGWIILFYTSLLTNEINTLIKTNNLVTVIVTMTTVIDALLITSLSVFGSSKSYSVTLLSKNNLMRIKFFVYIFGLLFFSIIVFLLSIFWDKNIKIYLYIVLIFISFFISYSYICIVMFNKNIENFKQDEKNEENEKKQLLHKLKKIEQSINIMINTLNEIKNK